MLKNAHFLEKTVTPPRTPVSLRQLGSQPPDPRRCDSFLILQPCRVRFSALHALYYPKEMTTEFVLLLRLSHFCTDFSLQIL